MDNRSYFDIIEDIADSIFYHCHIHILSHPRHGICIKTIHRDNTYYIVYYDEINGFYMCHEFYDNENIKCHNTCKFGYHFLDNVEVVNEDYDEYVTIYDYGIVDIDTIKFSRILGLFLVLPRDARPINRLAFLDISVITTSDT